MEGITNSERQENELEILQAILIDDIEDLRKSSAWKVWRPLDILIKLQPQQSMTENKEIHVSADLHIKCSEEYPNVVPSIFIKNGKGLSNTQMQELRKQLLEIANRLKGEVMILDLTQHAQKFLHDNNKKVFQSFYEEMLQNKKKQEEEIAKAEQRRRESEQNLIKQQQKVIEEEINRKQEELKEESRKRKKSSLSESSNGSEKSDRISRSRNSVSPLKEVKSSIKSECKHSGVAILTYRNHSKRTVQRGECLGHSQRGSATMIGMDVDSGKSVAIIEWIVPCSLKNKDHDSKQHSNDIYKQISSIEQELAVISKTSHENLVPYLGLYHQTERDKILIYLFQEFIKGCSLESYLNQNIPLETSLARHYAKLIVEFLTFTHNNDVVHRDLRATSIFIDDCGRVKICDFTLDKRLFDLRNTCLSEPVPDIYPPTLGRGSKKGDVYRFGIIVLSLSLGRLVSDLAPKVPSTLPNDLQDFLKNCLHPNERERWTFSQLSSHPFLKHNPMLNSILDEKVCQNSKNNDLDPTETDSLLLQVPNLNIDVGKQSRLYNEFEILNFLGSGGFGDVLKVRNRLDGRVYAIKRISLDPSRQQLNRKIMREVKLLSRLNHENIVRYYNSWIETSQQPVDLNVSSTSQSDATSENKALSIPSKKEELKAISEEDLEKFAPPQLDISVEWSVSYEYSHAPVNDNISSSDDEDDDEEDDVYGSSMIQRTDSSESVVFEGADQSTEKSKEKSKSSKLSTQEEAQELNPKPRCLQFMYIQMEFCEKSTLRQKIDNKLYEDLNLVWRLFREIIEGLVHIHQQGMIHRDLKPVNIFLDSNNHIKIGDFGLATTDIISKVSMNDSVAATGQNSFCSMNNSIEKSNLNLLGNENMTGRVGTALYVAPELLSSNAKVVYNQKVDIYSLGIIFFEMSYPAPSTGMERINLLSKLRQPEIALPDDSVEVLDHRQIFLINRLLQHDPSKRPTAEELLTSDVLPPPQLEEAELDEMLRHTVSNPQSKAYKRMITALFRQKTSPAADFTYDLDAHKGSNKYFIALNSTIETVERILKKHGAIKVTIPTLMPKCSLTESETHVHFMDHGGGVVSLPSNLRVLFARYVARRDITQLKRYAIEKIYVERKVYGCHPREMYQCAFDLVTPVPNLLLPDAEVLSIASEILSEFPILSGRNYYIRLNHLNLLKALLSSSQIPDEKHNDILRILSDIKAKATCKSKLHEELLNLKISEQSISFLFRYIDLEDNFTKVDQMLRAITKRKSLAATLATQSLREIQDVLKYAEMLGMKLPAVVAPCFVFGAPLYSGIVFQIVCELNKKDGKGKIDVIGVGGRYDKLVSSFRMNPSRDVNQFAVGFSLDLEKIINCEIDNKEIASLYDAVLCSVGQKPMIKEKCSVLKNLWSFGIYTHVIYDSSTSLEEAGIFCKENNVNVLLILKENDLSNIKVRLYEKDRFTEKKFVLGEIGEYISKLRLPKSEQLEGQQANRNELSRTSSSTDASVSSQTPLIKITFVPLPTDKNFTLSKKKRLEGMILTNLSQSTCMQLISGKTCVEVVCVDLVSSTIKTIISYIELDLDEAAFQESLGSIIEKHHSLRKYLTKIFDVIHELKFEKNCPVIALYSSIDYIYKLLL